jgi:hypothetical protein
MSQNEEGRRRAVFISVTTTFVLASIFVAGRLASRFGILKRHGWDDFAFILAWVSVFILTPRLSLTNLPPGPRFWSILRNRFQHIQGHQASRRQYQPGLGHPVPWG